jgi:tRNA pseudouridine32 synthase / 23S rRNA pseudouridine746 synthase
MELLFENPHFVAVDKPAGWLTVPGRTGTADTRPCLGRTLEAELDKRLYPVHRLDAEVSGLVLFARDETAHRIANAWFEAHTLRKRYEALTEGEALELVPGREVEWRSQLLRGKKRAYVSPHGKLAVTRATFVRPHADALLWRLEPLTGRSHQLRVHLASHGFPILGDTLYGARVSLAAGGIALRAVSLSFAACPEAASLGLPDRLAVRQGCAGDAPVL